ncbi:tryptophan 2,3-dioxygenase-like [Acanthaster planci]|uniref:Tryptophan 2,3-dioxygenase n=1 Tax=Acanthaster planci TaxID=133434 RepID=A0A8B7Y361_ACAPL|nr:tryptophan 2,3-dioxygenase-like [Acanthaster planci]XP_022086346.1 tryptophan 2,3-dioxygenase-like [Acanthaster planci]XP_022086347.1 tryptophan 2,3-dioxygenase-like [Acanthaster planci]
MSCPFMSGERREDTISSSNNGSDGCDGGGGDAIQRAAGPSKEDNPALHYHKYLQLEKVLSSQQLESERQGCKVHDEHLFIVIHQVYELWFKQILYEIDSVRSLLSQVPFDERKQLVINQRMGRVVTIMKVVVEQIHVLETMTPMDFLEFRTYLAPASGFESQQFRVLENRLGIKPEWRVKYSKRNYEHAHKGELLAEIKRAEVDPSLLSIVQQWLERTPGLETSGFNFWAKFEAAANEMMRDILKDIEEIEDGHEKEAMMQEHNIAKESFSSVFDVEKHKAMLSRGDRRFSHKALQGALLISLYREESRFSQPFQFLTLLMDLDSLLMKWRLNHVQLVQRMIGGRPGTGGSSGYLYLKATASDRYKVFVDLFNLSTFLLPRKYIPALTPDMQRRLSIPYGKINGNVGNLHIPPALVETDREV